MTADLPPSVDELDAPSPAVPSTRQRRRRVLITVGAVLLALLVTNLLLPDWLLPGQSRTLCGTCDERHNRINGQTVRVDVADDGTVSVQIGAGTEVTGLHVGDSAYGPWWWGSVTITKAPSRPRDPPQHSVPTSSTSEPGAPTLATTSPRPVGGDMVTVRWTPW